MPRDIPVGNGTFLVTFDGSYSMRDIYFPCVGKENHTDGHRFRFGIWVDGVFKWVGGGWDPEAPETWNIGLDYSGESLVTHVVLTNGGTEVALHSNDLVDYRENIFIRRAAVKNLSDAEKEVRVFFHHDFHIMGSAIGDTAYYDPDEKAIIHYKENRYFLMSGMRPGTNGPSHGPSHGIDQYATGVKEFHGREGTWRDAEDGHLEGGAIAQGSVDSVLSFTLKVPAGVEKTFYYWMCAAEDYSGASRLNKMVLGHGPEYFIKRTDDYWRAWVNKEEFDLSALPPEVAGLFKKSLLILRTNIDSSGAIIAGNDSDIQHFARDTYSYMWPRDGALTAYALDMAGYHGLTRGFFDFCLKIISKGKESVGYFLHKYNPDGSLGSSWHPWVGREGGRKGEKEGKMLPIQEDGTGLVLWALWHHFDKSRDIEFAVSQFEGLVRRCGDFLASYRDKSGLPLPSYDLWEENWGIHTFTASTVCAGLRAAQNFASFFGDGRRAKIYGRAAGEIKEAMGIHLFSREQGRFLRGVAPKEDGSPEPDFRPDLMMDASVYAPFYFGVFSPDDEKVAGTMHTLRDRLWVKTPVGGVARYEGDNYYRASGGNGPPGNPLPGNPWFICTLWLAQWHTAKAKDREGLKEALEILKWVASRALPSGVLAEQVHPFTNEPLSVSPLTWSHAAFVAAVLEYLKKLGEIDVCPACGRPLISHERGAH